MNHQNIPKKYRLRGFKIRNFILSNDIPINSKRYDS